VTVFWLLAALMVLIALAFVIPPLFRRPRTETIRNDELNVRVIQDQLAELDADFQAGRIDRSVYELSRHDLQRELLDDVDDTAVSGPATAEAAGRGGRWVALVLLFLVPLLAVPIYWQIGSPGIIPRLAAGSSAMATNSGGDPHSRERMDAMVTALAARMQQEPENLEGWILLGRSYAMMKRFKESVDAYRHAVALNGKDPDILSSYADALVMEHNGEFTDQVGDLLNQALAVDPQNPKALWLRGHWRFRRSNFQGAIDDWQKVAGELPADSKDVATIREQINTARDRLGKPPVVAVASAAKPAAAVPPASVSSTTAIQVQITLDPGLQKQAAPEDTVFIFARALHGPRMPLAIVRKRVADLPVSVTLDDSLAMSPAMVLSKFKQVVIGARVSKSGQALPSSGDLQGQVSPVDTQGSVSVVQVKIDTVVP